MYWIFLYFDNTGLENHTILAVRQCQASQYWNNLIGYAFQRVSKVVTFCIKTSVSFFVNMSYIKLRLSSTFCGVSKLSFANIVLFKSDIMGVATCTYATSSPGLFPQKMGGAGKGPGIGWSRVQPKYSWEANLYATRWFCADRREQQ